MVFECRLCFYNYQMDRRIMFCLIFTLSHCIDFVVKENLVLNYGSADKCLFHSLIDRTTGP